MRIGQADSHVHSEFSWDTGGPDGPAAGSMRALCARAERVGLPGIVFTEHLDLDPYLAAPETVTERQHGIYADGTLHPPPLDVDRYLESIERCRREFAELRIRTGVEYGQPHLSDARVARVVDLAALDRVNGSLHTLPFGAGRAEPATLYRHLPADEVMRAYLDEIPRMVAGSDSFEVFTHIDYAVRSWPVATSGPFDPRRFEEGFRAGMRAIADSGRALEINTGRTASWIPQWWAEEGGRAVTFGSDAHADELDALARGFGEAALMASAFGFAPGRDPFDPWTRGR